MADQAMVNNSAMAAVPLRSADEIEVEISTTASPSQYPQLEFSNGWKDRVFAIIFWIHGLAIILVAICLGIPAVVRYSREELRLTSFDSNLKNAALGLSTAVAVSGFVSFVVFFILQQFSSRLITFSFLIIIIIQTFIGVALFFMYWPLCFLLGSVLLFTLIYLSCIRTHISFAEVHLELGCKSLHRYPSLVFFIAAMVIVEFIWIVFWLLFIIGIYDLPNGSLSIGSSGAINNQNNEMQSYVITDTESLLSIAAANSAADDDGGGDRLDSIHNSLSSFRTLKQQMDNLILPTENSGGHSAVKRVRNILMVLSVLSLYWGLTTFANIVQFITATVVGRWWFDNENNQQYAFRMSVKRALAMNFGTICCGSCFEMFIKVLPSTVERKHRRGVLSCAVLMAEKCICYFNEWAFIYSALTGRGFVEASQSCVELFQKRGWTMAVNDSIIGTTFAFINITVGLVSGIVAAFILYILFPVPSEDIQPIVMVAMIGFIFGLSSSVVTTIVLKSCARTILLCFAINPVLLGTINPDYLHKLTEVWLTSHPEEFSISGDTRERKKPADMEEDL